MSADHAQELLKVLKALNGDAVKFKEAQDYLLSLIPAEEISDANANVELEAENQEVAEIEVPIQDGDESENEQAAEAEADPDNNGNDFQEEDE